MLQSYSLINTVSKISGISEWVFIQLAPPELYVIKYGLVRNSQNDFLSQYRIDYLSTNNLHKIIFNILDHSQHWPEKESLYLSPNYSFQAAWDSQTTTGLAKLLGKKKWGWDIRFTQAVFWIKMTKYIVGDIFSSGRVCIFL